MFRLAPDPRSYLLDSPGAFAVLAPGVFSFGSKQKGLAVVGGRGLSVKERLPTGVRLTDAILNRMTARFRFPAP
jgi:hypothetical protein